MSGTEVSICLLDHGYAPLFVALAPLCLVPFATNLGSVATASVAHFNLKNVPLVFSILCDCFPFVCCFPGIKY